MNSQNKTLKPLRWLPLLALAAFGVSCGNLPGACCTPEGTCTDEANLAACLAAGGIFEGHGTDCASTSCPILPGACCAADGSCTEEANQVSCDALGGLFAGHGTTRKLSSGRNLGYIVPVEAATKSFHSQAISMTAFQDVNEAIPAKHVLYLMDACYVGDERVRAQLGGFYGGWITRNVLGPFKGTQGSDAW